MAVATAKVARHMHGLNLQAPILMKEKKKWKFFSSHHHILLFSLN
jgi:hypothetical protein